MHICLYLYYLRKGQVFKLKAVPQTFDPLSNGEMPQHSAMQQHLNATRQILSKVLSEKPWAAFGGQVSTLFL